jgi:hypothetical protein
MPEKAKSTETKETEAAPSTAVESSKSDTHELVFTVKTSTGEVVKVETLDKNGARREFSDEQYSELAAYTSGANLTGIEAYGYDPQGAAYAYGACPDPSYEAGYYQGLADYTAAVEASNAAAAAYTPEELAYYQGMADYAASVG